MNADQRLLAFAGSMKRLPKKAVKCDVYPDVSYTVIDEKWAKNIFRKVSPAASRDAIWEGLKILNLRLDFES